MQRKVSGNNQVKLGALFSYVLIIVNAAYGLLVTPFILQSLGESSYGVYKILGSLTSSMMVLDLGLGGTVMRYVAKFRSENDDREIQKFISMALLEAVILAIVAAAAALVMYVNISDVYGKSFTETELSLAHIIFVILAVNVVIHIVENVFNGIITGCNNFIFGNGIKLITLLVKIILIGSLLTVFKSAVVLVCIDLALSAANVIIEVIYIKAVYKFRIRISFRSWNKEAFRESFIYTLLMFLTSIAAQVNNNLDNVVIGAISGTGAVTVYSFGITIFSMYQQLSTSISGVMLPTVTNVLKDDNDGQKIQDMVVNAGRVQFALLGAAAVGFIVLGKEFISLWLGDGFEDVYFIALILMLPSLFELCVNVCLAVLRAKNKLGFRTGVLMASTLLNLLITIIGVTLWNYFAAAIGTAASFIIGSLIVMNIYYWKVLHFNMIMIYKKIVHRIWLCTVIAGAVTFISSKYIGGSWTAFIINVVVFCIVYGTLLLVWGISKQELKEIPIINRLIKERK